MEQSEIPSMEGKREMILQLAVGIAGVIVPVSAATLIAVNPLPPLSELPDGAIRSTVNYSSLPPALRDLLRGGGDQSPPSTVDVVVLVSAPEAADPHSPMSFDGGDDLNVRARDDELKEIGNDKRKICDDDRDNDRTRNNDRASDTQEPQKVVLVVNTVDDLKSARVGTHYILQFGNLHRLADASAYRNVITSRGLIWEPTLRTSICSLTSTITSSALITSSAQGLTGGKIWMCYGRFFALRG